MPLRPALLLWLSCGFMACKPSQLWVANGLDIPVLAAVGEETVTVPPRGKAPLKLKEGPQEIVITSTDGRELERNSFNFNKGACSIYSVLATTPMTSSNVFYGSEDSSPFFFTSKDLSDRETYFQKHFVQESHVDFCAMDSPERIQMSSDKRVKNRYLRIDGDWRMVFAGLKEPRGTTKQMAFLEKIVAAQPEVEESAHKLEELKEALKPRVPHPTLEWATLASSQHARVVQRADKEGNCEALCEFKDGSSPQWSKDACLSTVDDHRFVSDDCQWFVVVRKVGDQPLRWRESPVVKVYRHGVFERQYLAGNFVEKEELLKPSGAGFLWLSGSPQVSFSSGEIALTTADAQRHVVAVRNPPR